MSLFSLSAGNGEVVEDTDCPLSIVGVYVVAWSLLEDNVFILVEEDNVFYGKNIENAFIVGCIVILNPFNRFTLSIEIFVNLYHHKIKLNGLSVDKFLAQQKGNWGSIVEGDQSRSQVIVMPRNEFNHPQLTNNAADSVLLYRELSGISWRLNEVRTHMGIFYKKLIIICHVGKK
ncbi:hypothetical protein WN944_027151 [Citrus x changshan-huyou]|uniref:Uncharacterized protein n=1 Tax=Citrus x changshan-huyou TaxID=2935761 RepID=A0AAP0Q885_9ROSI